MIDRSNKYRRKLQDLVSTVEAFSMSLEQNAYSELILTNPAFVKLVQEARLVSTQLNNEEAVEAISDHLDSLTKE